MKRASPTLLLSIPALSRVKYYLDEVERELKWPGAGLSCGYSPKPLRVAKPASMNRAEGHVLVAADTTTRTFALFRCMKETAAIAEVVSVRKKPLTLERSGAEWPVYAI